MQEIIEFIVDHAVYGQRLDTLLADRFSQYTRSLIKKWIDNNNVTVNDKQVKPSYHIRENDSVKIIIPPPEPMDIPAQDIPLSIIFEDTNIVVIDKPAGMVVHPAPGNYDNTLVNALLYHCKNLSSINGVLRPGIVHRLDKDTTGVIVVAKNDLAHKSLVNQFSNRTTRKIYLAVVSGIIRHPKKRIIETLTGRHPVNRKKMSVLIGKGKKTVTEFRVLKEYDDFSLLKVNILTGRTHQIRVHMAHIGHPIIGDNEYGSSKTNSKFATIANRQMLHAFSLQLKHPVTEKEMIFRAHIPEDMRTLIKNYNVSSSK